MPKNASTFQRKTHRKIYPFYPLLVHSKQFLHHLPFLGNSSTGEKPGKRPKTAAKRKGEQKKENFDWCACTSEKVVKHDTGENQ